MVPQGVSDRASSLGIVEIGTRTPADVCSTGRRRERRLRRTRNPPPGRAARRLDLMEVNAAPGPAIGPVAEFDCTQQAAGCASARTVAENPLDVRDEGVAGS